MGSTRAIGEGAAARGLDRCQFHLHIVPPTVEQRRRSQRSHVGVHPICFLGGRPRGGPAAAQQRQASQW